MKRPILCIFLCLLLVCLCACNDTPAEPTLQTPEYTPLSLPSAELIAQTVSSNSGDIFADPSTEALDAAVNLRVAEILSGLSVSVTEPATMDAKLRVRYTGKLQEPLTPREEYEGVLSETVQGEAMLAVATDPDVLLGVTPDTTDLALGVLDPLVFALTEYAEHSILFHIEVLAVYRAPTQLTEIPDLKTTTGYETEEALLQALRAEESANLRLANAQNAFSVQAIPEDWISAIRADYIATYRCRYESAGTTMSFSNWLSLLTDYADEAALTADAETKAPILAKELFVACAVLDTLNVRDFLPSYEAGATPLATENGYHSVRFFTWNFGGSASVWTNIISAYCIDILSK